jgi:hypothetical protein
MSSGARHHLVFKIGGRSHEYAIAGAGQKVRRVVFVRVIALRIADPGAADTTNIGGRQQAA